MGHEKDAVVHDAKVLVIYGVDREQREVLRRVAARKGKRSVAELIREHIKRLVREEEKAAS